MSEGADGLLETVSQRKDHLGVSRASRKEEGRDEPSLSGRESRPREVTHLPRLGCFSAGVQAFIFGSKQIVQDASLTSLSLWAWLSCL